MDTDSFIAYTETYDIYGDIAEDVKTSFDTSRKIFGVMRDELGGEINK